MFRSTQHTQQRHLPHVLAATADIRAALDAGTPIPTGCSPHALAAALLAFCAELPQPLVPPAVVEEIQASIAAPAPCPIGPSSPQMPPPTRFVLPLWWRRSRQALLPPLQPRYLPAPHAAPLSTSSPALVLHSHHALPPFDHLAPC